jgi:hypothetical protein
MNSPSPAYGAIIERAFRRRREPGAIARHPVHHMPAYVVQMCEELIAACKSHSTGKIQLDDVLRIDRAACGHVDYQAKLELYCRDLERSQPL